MAQRFWCHLKQLSSQTLFPACSLSYKHPNRPSYFISRTISSLLLHLLLLNVVSSPPLFHTYQHINPGIALQLLPLNPRIVLLLSTLIPPRTLSLHQTPLLPALLIHILHPVITLVPATLLLKIFHNLPYGLRRALG